MKFTLSVICAVALIAQHGYAFTSRGLNKSARRTGTNLFLEPSALTDYMAKAHEEKLKAIKIAEQKKEAEIQELKKQVEELKKAPPASGALVAPSTAPGANIGDMTKEELAAKLLTYQQFMAKYIVNAQQEKMKAVQAAEMAMKNKYEEKLKLLEATRSSSELAVPVQTEEKSLYSERSAKVAAAAKAGKSRWGDMENAKAAQAVGVTISTPSPAPEKLTIEPVNGVMVVNGATIPVKKSLFDKRNEMVAAAAKAGKSRWGDMEVAKATKSVTVLRSAPAPAPTPALSVPAAVPVPPEVAAADHGLRNDGGVGGPSLAERINLGAQLVSALVTPAAPATTESKPPPSLYEKRNAMVVAAAKAGKSRWGDMEIKKTEALLTALPAASNSVPVPPEVAAADHGLRNDGGVGGPTLAQRINLGAALLGH